MGLTPGLTTSFSWSQDVEEKDGQGSQGDMMWGRLNMASLALKTEGAAKQGSQAASRSLKRQGNAFTEEPPTPRLYLREVHF